MKEPKQYKDSIPTSTFPVDEDSIDTKFPSYDALKSEYQKLLAHYQEMRLERDMLYRVVQATPGALHQ